MHTDLRLRGTIRKREGNRMIAGERVVAQSISMPIDRPSPGMSALFFVGTLTFSRIFSGVASTDKADIGWRSLTAVGPASASFFLRCERSFARLAAMLTDIIRIRASRSCVDCSDVPVLPERMFASLPDLPHALHRLQRRLHQLAVVADRHVSPLLEFEC